MKNIKKLLGLVTVLGLLAMTSSNVIACSNNNSKVTNNDLTKSFMTTDSALGLNNKQLDTLGLSKAANSNTYNFNPKNLQQSAVQTWIHANSDAKVTKVVQDVNKISDITPNSEIAQYSADIQTEIPVQSDSAQTVSFNLKLTLYQAIGTTIDPFDLHYQATKTTMTVTINVATKDVRTDLNQLSPMTITSVDAGNIIAFKSNLVTAIKQQPKFTKLTEKDLTGITVQDGTKSHDMTVSDLNATTKSLAIICQVDPNNLNFSYHSSPKAVTVTLTKVNKVDINNLNLNLNVNSLVNEVASFTTNLLTALTNVQYPAFSSDQTLKVTKADGSSILKPEDIVNNQDLVVKVIALSNSNYFIGCATANVNLTTNLIDLSKPLNNKTFTITKIAAYDLTAFKTQLFKQIADLKIAYFNLLTIDDLNLNCKASDIFTNTSLPVTISAANIKGNDYTGSANVTVNLTTTAIDLKNLSDNDKVSNVQAYDLSGFTTALITQLNHNQGFENLQLNNIVITNQAGKALTSNDIVTNNKLVLNINVSQSTPGGFTGTKQITVALTVNQINLNNLTNVSVKDVTAKDLDAFTIALVTQLNQQPGYSNLTKENIIITNPDGTTLDSAAIITNPTLGIKIAVSKTPGQFTGSVVITVNLTTK